MNTIFVVVISAIIGGLVTYVFNKIGSKSSPFIYRQTSNRIATAASDRIFGDVSVTWQGTPVNNLYFTTIELENASYRDFKDVTINVYCGTNLFLLTSTALIKDTTQILNLSSKYFDRIGDLTRERTPDQRSILDHSLEYICPIFNRGQKIHMNILSTSVTGYTFSDIFVEVLHPGVRLVQGKDVLQILGVPVTLTASFGLTLGVTVTALAVIFIKHIVVVAIIALLMGLTVNFLGALVILGMKKLRHLVSR